MVKYYREFSKQFLGWYLVIKLKLSVEVNVSLDTATFSDFNMSILPPDVSLQNFHLLLISVILRKTNSTLN